MPSKEKTNFELFADSGGALFIKEHFKCPVPRAKYGRLEFDIQRFTNVTSGDWAMALRIEYEDTDENTWADHVDEQEIAPLCAAARECVRQRAGLGEVLADYLEFVFSTKSGFTIGFFYDRTTKARGDFLKIAGRSVFLVSFAELVTVLEKVLARICELRTIFDGTNEAEQGEARELLPK